MDCITFAQTALSRTLGKDQGAFIAALIRCEQEWLRQYAKLRPAGDQFIRSNEDNSPAAHIELLERFLSVMALAPLIPDATISPPTLWHPDLDKSNVLVSPAPPHEIFGVIGWQAATTGPRCLQTKFPKAMVYTGGRFEIDYEQGIPPSPKVLKD